MAMSFIHTIVGRLAQLVPSVRWKQKLLDFLVDHHADFDILRPALSDGILSNDPELLEKCAEVISIMGTQASELSSDILKAVEGSSGKPRIMLLSALARVGKADEVQAFMPELMKEVDDPGSPSRFLALGAISKIKHKAKSQIPALMRLMKASEMLFKIELATSLVDIGCTDEVLVDVLIEELERENSNGFDFRVIQALGDLGEVAKKAIPILQTIVQSKAQNYSKTVAERALEMIQLFPVMADQFKRGGEAERLRVIGNLGKNLIGREKFVLELIRIGLEDSNPRVRSGVIGLTHHLDGERIWEIVPLLINAMGADSSDEVRADAAMVLSIYDHDMANEKVRAAFIKAMADPSHKVAIQVSTTLGGCGKEMLPLLENARKEDNSQVRRMADYLIKKITKGESGTTQGDYMAFLAGVGKAHLDKPQNEVERKIVEFQTSRDVNQFVNSIINAELYVQCEKSKDGSPSTKIMGDLVDTAAGRLFPVFTHQERLEIYYAHQADFMGIQGFRLVMLLPEGVGMVINPGYEMGGQLPAELAGSIKKQLLAKDNDNGKTAQNP